MIYFFIDFSLNYFFFQIQILIFFLKFYKKLADIYTNKIFITAKNLDENISNMGRIACIKFDNMLDTLALLTKEVKINLPLVDGTCGEPIIYPS